MQRHQRIHRGGIERRRIAVLQRARKSLVAVILDYEQAALFIRFVDGRRREAEAVEMARDPAPRPHVFLRRRRIHQQCRPRPAGQAEIAAERGVVRESLAPRALPGAARQERLDGGLAWRHAAKRFAACGATRAMFDIRLVTGEIV